jgi:hypothetical protein
VRISHTFNPSLPSHTRETYHLASEQGFRFLPFCNSFARLQVDFSYNSTPKQGREKADIAYIANLGYEFEL